VVFATIKRGSSKDGCFVITKEDPPFFISNSQLLRWNLQEGMELDKETYEKVLYLKKEDDCKEKAIALLTLREHSTLELKQKLLVKQFPKDMVERTVSSLKEDGSLSDERYAEMLVRSRQRRNPEGKVMLLQRLLAKGVRRSVAENAIDAAFKDQGDDFIQNAYQQIARTTTDTQKQMMKLQRKGFSYGEIKKVLKNKQNKED
jgi:regulatory protein